ncbi:tRNA (adenosine(37)-N6)-dimethylallyltransferase MiaA [Patescibacteria group bacterium]|nr:tRNA (adenosine(37)-N6)-dimethylallyltransferase MiaA [Patescibacteria group bacterium]MBU1721218.1 tRNA (adenosine(37)-N6)-dimethylallyltransferase MiaA [Patescibacteria group bacterium]MBU1901074.1 tRNA (adenosine(37)-N6)-dimethylallyltransferase MiaA [Patescibacteria group bacterium]
MNTTKNLQKVIVLVGPTASGKTDWSLRFAKKYKGEIISADSRQVYKKMSIGTAKAEGIWEWGASWKGLRRTYHVEGVPHHLIDFLDPGKRFTVAEFRDRALKYIKLSFKHGRIPMIVGGTGLYVSSLVDNFNIPRVEPNNKLRKSLEEKPEEELLGLLQKMDPVAVKTIDGRNKRRVIRALEVCILTGEPFSQQKKQGEPLYDFLQIGVDAERSVLHSRINTRVDKMLDAGLLEEINGLLKQKYSWDLPSMSGIGYRQFRAYLEGTRSVEESVELLKRDTRRYAKRQMTWFNRDKRVVWCKTYEEAEQKMKAFLEIK